MAAALKVREDIAAADLRCRARSETGRVAARMYAIANALSGMSREKAAELAGMDRQALRDAVTRFNAEGVDGLYDRPRSGRPSHLTEEQLAALKAAILEGPDTERDGLSAYTLKDICEIAEKRWSASYHPASMSRLVRSLGLSRQKPRPLHPKTNKAAQEAFKGGLEEALNAARKAHPGKKISFWFEDEARIGQKGRVTRRWWIRGARATGRRDHRFTYAYIYAAVCPGTDRAHALVLPITNAEATSVFLESFGNTLAPDEHALVVMDQAGFHGATALRVPDTVTIVFLPPYSPELNPVERIWLYLKERYLSHRRLDDDNAILDAASTAWNRLCAEPGRLASLTAYPWIPCVSN